MSEWSFLAEGGQHIVYTNGTRILRIDKKKPDERNQSTIAHSLCEHFAPYTDVPIFRKGRDVFGATTSVSGLTNTKLFEQQEEIVAQDLPDYRILSSCTQSSICLEIKPKAGYTAISPLVITDRRIKFTKTRFEIQQQLYSKGLLRKRWMNADQTFVKSSYNPLDLFSGNLERIRGAVSAMFRNPQNNIKAWKQGRCCTSHIDGGCLNEAERALFGTVDLSLPELVASVLQSEPFLGRVLQYQKLDIIDADGAIILYERLVNAFCNGDADSAEQFMDNVEWDDTICDTATSKHELLQYAPISSNGTNPQLIHQYCEHTKALQDVLRGKQPCIAVVQDICDETLSLLGDFSAKDCCFLLQCWLLSLAMCDLSFFITLKLASSNGSTPSNLQTSTIPGRIYFKQYLIEYELKCIDYDFKPAKKLRSRRRKESLITEDLFS